MTHDWYKTTQGFSADWHRERMKTLEQSAWQLWSAGVDYADIATNANLWDCSMEEAIERMSAS